MKTMALSRPLFALVGIFSGLALAAACSNYVPPDVATYGPPSGLKGQTPLAPNGEDAGSTSGGGNDSGSTSTSGDAGGGGAGGVMYACGTPIDGGPCTVSWSKDIYPNMQAGGAWNCAGAACHGNGVQQPLFSGTEHTDYATLANYKGTAANGDPYLDPCSTDPTKSDFVCNVQTTGGCGAAPMPLGAALAASDVTKITTWVSCGAPEN